MSSFKLEKGGSTKDQAMQGGVFLALVGVPVLLFISMGVGAAMIVLGAVIAFGAKFASS